MNKFKLHIGDTLQGKFELRDLNIAFVFQVNCPGCFIYGIPMMNRLYGEFSETIGFIGISTAFEDFDHNTAKNTELLLSSGKTVGETSKYLKEMGQTTYGDIPRFPVAFDTLTTYQDQNVEDLLDTIESKYPRSNSRSPHEKKEMSSRLESYYGWLEAIALTFTLNQMQGTPSLVIFDKDFNTLDYSFGHTDEQRIHKLLQQKT